MVIQIAGDLQKVQWVFPVLQCYSTVPHGSYPAPQQHCTRVLSSANRRCLNLASAHLVSLARLPTYISRYLQRFPLSFRSRLLVSSPRRQTRQAPNLDESVSIVRQKSLTPSSSSSFSSHNTYHPTNGTTSGPTGPRCRASPPPQPTAGQSPRPPAPP